MKNSKTDTAAEKRAQIIQGALHVFALKGFTKATNRDIANAAGIRSPGLIYHYFENKEDLLRAVIENFAPEMKLLYQSQTLLALPPREGLQMIGAAYLSLVDNPDAAAGFRVIVSEVVQSQTIACVAAEAGPLRIMALTAGFLQKKMDEKLLLAADPFLAARCFLGPLITYMFTRNLLFIQEQPKQENSVILQETIRIFLEGLQAK